MNPPFPGMPTPPYTPPMTFGESIRKVLSQQNYCNFKGRASRAEFWWFYLFTLLVSWGLAFLGQLFWQGFFMSVSGVFSLAMLLPTLGLTWRRLHDTGRAGGWFFIVLIPLIGFLILIWWWATPSQPGDNRFGPQPVK